MRFLRFAGIVWLVAAAAPLGADTRFNIRRMTRNDVPFGRGQCDIRLQIDGEAEVSVRGDSVYIRTISGRDGRDDGSECNESFPMGNVRNFNYEVRDSRGDIAMLGSPGRNGVTVRIRDSKGGEGRYHFRLTWDIDRGGGGFPGGGGDRPGGGFGGNRPGGGNRFTVERAMDLCRDEVRGRIIDRYRFDRVEFRGIRADDRPGRNDYIVGDALGRRGNAAGDFTFVCQVDFNSGRVRSVDVNRR